MKILFLDAFSVSFIVVVSIKDFLTDGNQLSINFDEIGISLPTLPMLTAFFRGGNNGFRFLDDCGFGMLVVALIFRVSFHYCDLL